MPPPPGRCLTLHQPWASLVVHGVKRAEGRVWGLARGKAVPPGRLWIHSAAKEMAPEDREAIESFYRECYALDGEAPSFPKHYPRSALLGCVDLVRVVPQHVFQELDVSAGVRAESSSEFVFLCEKPCRLLMPLRAAPGDGGHKIWQLPPKTLRSALDQAPTPVTQPGVRDVDFAGAVKKHDSGWTRASCSGDEVGAAGHPVGGHARTGASNSLARAKDSAKTNDSSAQADDLEDAALAAAVAASLETYHRDCESREDASDDRRAGAGAIAASCPVLETEGDLLDCDADYIAHQCNCVTLGAKGLAKAMFSRFPYADTYRRGLRRVVGTCDVMGDGTSARRFVLNLYGQYGVGKGKRRGKGGSSGAGRISLTDPVPVDLPDDSREAREAYFQQSLAAFERTVGAPFTGSIAFPFGIGCNLAGGSWPRYRSMILEFASRNPQARVIIYKRPGAQLPKRHRKRNGRRKGPSHHSRAADGAQNRGSHQKQKRRLPQNKRGGGEGAR